MINIWVMVIAVVALTAGYIHLFTLLWVLESLLITFLSALVSLRLYYFANSLYSDLGVMTSPVKYRLILILSILLFLIPLFRIARTFYILRKSKQLIYIVDSSFDNFSLPVICITLALIFQTLRDVFPVLRFNWLIILIFLISIFLATYFIIKFDAESKNIPKAGKGLTFNLPKKP